MKTYDRVLSVIQWGGPVVIIFCAYTEFAVKTFLVVAFLVLFSMWCRGSVSQ